MGTTLFIIIGAISIAAFVFAQLIQPPHQPPVIYVQVAPEPQPPGLGCLPLIVIGISIFVVYLLAGA